MAEYRLTSNRKSDAINLRQSDLENKNTFSLNSLITPSPRRLTVKLTDRLIFFRQLSVILQSGVALAQGLDLLSQNINDKNFSNCIKDISNELSSGTELSTTFKKYPKVFDPVITGLIEAGEAGGILSEVLERIAALLEAQNKIKGQIVGALTYPVIILFLATSVSLGLLIFIVPSFEALFEGLNSDLPALTALLLSLSRFVTSPVFLFGAPIIIFIALYAFNTFYRTSSGKLIVDNFVLKIPLFGSLVLRSEMASLSDTLSTLVNAGVPIVEALEKCIVASNNQIIKNTISKSIAYVKEGQLLSYSMSSSKVVPGLFTSMLRIGEETGELSLMLENLANFYKREVEETVTNLTKAMEPAVIFVVAAIVGTIVVGLYLPMFALLDAVN